VAIISFLEYIPSIELERRITLQLVLIDYSSDELTSAFALLAAFLWSFRVQLANIAAAVNLTSGQQAACQTKKL